MKFVLKENKGREKRKINKNKNLLKEKKCINRFCVYSVKFRLVKRIRLDFFWCFIFWWGF